MLCAARSLRLSRAAALLLAQVGVLAGKRLLSAGGASSRRSMCEEGAWVPRSHACQPRLRPRAKGAGARTRSAGGASACACAACGGGRGAVTASSAAPSARRAAPSSSRSAHPCAMSFSLCASLVPDVRATTRRSSATWRGPARWISLMRGEQQCPARRHTPSHALTHCDVLGDLQEQLPRAAHDLHTDVHHCFALPNPCLHLQAWSC